LAEDMDMQFGLKKEVLLRWINILPEVKIEKGMICFARNGIRSDTVVSRMQSLIVRLHSMKINVVNLVGCKAYGERHEDVETHAGMKNVILHMHASDPCEMYLSGGRIKPSDIQVIHGYYQKVFSRVVRFDIVHSFRLKTFLEKHTDVSETEYRTYLYKYAQTFISRGEFYLVAAMYKKRIGVCSDKYFKWALTQLSGIKRKMEAVKCFYRLGLPKEIVRVIVKFVGFKDDFSNVFPFITNNRDLRYSRTWLSMERAMEHYPD